MSRTFHPRRKRRPDDGRFLPKDAAAWRRLIFKARQAARNPKAFAAGVGEAATRCAKAVPPPGYATRDSCFMRLILKGVAVWQSTGEARDRAAGELEALAQQCADALDRGSLAAAAVADPAGSGDPTRPDANGVRGARDWRERKDIDG